MLPGMRFNKSTWSHRFIRLCCLCPDTGKAGRGGELYEKRLASSEAFFISACNPIFFRRNRFASMEYRS